MSEGKDLNARPERLYPVRLAREYLTDNKEPTAQTLVNKPVLTVNEICQENQHPCARYADIVYKFTDHRV